MRQAEGDYVQKTLHLMDDSICERQALPVFHFGTTVLSHHVIDLPLHFLCAGGRENVQENLSIGRIIIDLATSHLEFATYPVCLDI